MEVCAEVSCRIELLSHTGKEALSMKPECSGSIREHHQQEVVMPAMAPAPAPLRQKHQHHYQYYIANITGMDVLQKSQMAKSLLKKAVQVDVLQNREQVRVWRIHTPSGNSFALKWMPEWRLRTSREQVLAELRAGLIFKEMHGRAHPLICYPKAAEIISSGVVMCYVYAGDSASLLAASDGFKNMSSAEREPIVKALLTSTLKAITFLEAVPDRYGGRHLHRDIKLDNICGRQVAGGSWIFPLIDFGAFIPVDGSLDDFFAIIDMRYVDTRQAEYDAEIGDHALDTLGGLYFTTSPTIDVRSAGLAAFEMMCGIPKEVDPHHYNINDEAGRHKFLEQVHQFTWVKHLKSQVAAKVLSNDMGHCLSLMLNGNPDLRKSASEVLAHPWLAGEAQKLDQAVAAAAEDWAAADEELGQMLGDELCESSDVWIYCMTPETEDEDESEHFEDEELEDTAAAAAAAAAISDDCQLQPQLDSCIRDCNAISSSLSDSSSAVPVISSSPVRASCSSRHRCSSSCCSSSSSGSIADLNSLMMSSPVTATDPATYNSLPELDTNSSKDSGAVTDSRRSTGDALWFAKSYCRAVMQDSMFRICSTAGSSSVSQDKLFMPVEPPKQAGPCAEQQKQEQKVQCLGTTSSNADSARHDSCSRIDGSISSTVVGNISAEAAVLLARSYCRAMMQDTVVRLCRSSTESPGYSEYIDESTTNSSSQPAGTTVLQQRGDRSGRSSSGSCYDSISRGTETMAVCVAETDSCEITGCQHN